MVLDKSHGSVGTNIETKLHHHHLVRAQIILPRPTCKRQVGLELYV